MLDIFTSPDDNPSIELETLNQFICWVQECELPISTKEQAIKVLECFRFIRVNLDALSMFINQKQDFIPLLPLRDQINQCIRDHQGSSMHFNSYESGEQACANLEEIIYHFESIFIEWRDSNNTQALHCLVVKFNWDAERGCLEARVAEPMSFIAVYKSSGMYHLKDLIQLAQSLHFIGLDSYDCIMADAFFAPIYDKAVLIDNRQQTLSRALVFEYMLIHLGYSPLSEEEFANKHATKKDDPQAFFREAFTYLTEHAEPVVTEPSGNYKYAFKSKRAADNCCLWLRRCPLLQEFDIRNCLVSQESGFFVLPLTSVQMNQLNPQFLAPLSVPDSTLKTPTNSPKSLHTFLKNPAPQFMEALNSLSTEELDRQILDTSGSPDLLLISVAFNQTSEALMAVIRKTSASALGRSIRTSYRNTSGPLAVIFNMHNQAVAMAIINKVAAIDLGCALFIHDSPGYTALMFAAMQATPGTFQLLVNKVPADYLSRALTMGTKWGNTALILTARYQDSKSWLLLINKASTKSINQASVMINASNLTTLHLVNRMDHQSFMALLEKLSPESLDKVLSIQDSYGDTPLHLITRHQNEVAIQAVINKASTLAISSAVVLANHSGNTPMHSAHSQSSIWFMNIIVKATAEAIEKLVVNKNEQGHNLLDLTFFHQNIPAFFALIKKASTTALQLAGFFNPKFSGLLQAEIRLSSSANVCKEILALLLKWTALPDATKIDSATMRQLLRNTGDFISIERQKVLNFAAEIADSLYYTERQGLAMEVELANGSFMSFQNEHLAEEIRSHGLASWVDFFLVRKTYDKNPHKNVIHLILDRMFDEKTLVLPPENTARKTLYEGNLLIKIFSNWQPKARQLFTQQLQNPKKRVTLRAPKSTKNATYKYKHLEGRIVEWKEKQLKPKPWHSSHGKKTSMTLLSPLKYTRPFQFYQPGAEMIGILFRAAVNLRPGEYDLDYAKIKAMLLSDNGSYWRNWLGTLSVVTDYARQMQGINFTSLDLFKARIKHETKTNELLVEASKGSVLGIVIARDNPATRKKAKAFREELRKKLGLDLPIMLYNPETHTFIENLEQYERLQQIQTLLEEQATLQKVRPLSKPLLFNRNKRFEGEIYPAGVARRLEQIAKKLLELKIPSKPNQIPQTG